MVSAPGSAPADESVADILNRERSSMETESQTLGKRSAPSPPAGHEGHGSSKPRLEGSAILSRLSHPLSAHPQSPFRSFPAFQQPQRLCTFSFDHDRSLHHDDRCKRYFRGPPQCPTYQGNRDRRPQPRGADLNYGFERFRQRDETVNEHLDGLLASLRHRSLSAPAGGERREVDSARLRADVITWRGIATKVCTAWDQLHPPQGGRTEGFELNAMLVEDTLYLEEYVSPTRKAAKAEKKGDERLKRFGYYGYSFESWSTVDTPEDCLRAPVPQDGKTSNPYSDDQSSQDPPGWGGDVNTNQQWCYVVKTRLGPNRLILGGEVDCVQPPSRQSASAPASATTAGQDSLVELKTSMNIRPGNARDTQNFEAKLLKFYMQSFLLGVGTLVVGFRDPKGFLVTTQHFDTLSIPKMVRAGSVVGREASGREVLRRQSVWDPKDSIGFGDRIFTWIKEAVGAGTKEILQPLEGRLLPTEKALETYPVFRVSFQPPFDEITLRLLEPREVQDHVDGRVGFLTKEFYDFVVEMANERDSE